MFNKSATVRADNGLVTIGDADSGYVPLYRLFRSNGDRFYTTSESEAESARQIGFEWDGPALNMVGYLSSTQRPGTGTLHRLQKDGFHFYTNIDTEAQNAVRLYGYTEEYSPGYVFQAQVAGSKPLYRLFDGTKVHLYTTSLDEVFLAVNSYHFIYEGNVGYVFTEVPGSKSILTGVYYSPWYVGQDDDHYIINGQKDQTNRTVFYQFKNAMKAAFWDIGVQNHSQTVSWPKYNKTAANGTVIANTVWLPELDYLYGAFAPFFEPAGVDSAWYVVKQQNALKKFWNQKRALYDADPSPNKPPFYLSAIPPGGLTVFPEPLDASQNLLAYALANSTPTVQLQKRLAADYGIDFMMLEWYWNYDSTIHTTLLMKGAPIDVFFGTAPERGLKLALNWIIADADRPYLLMPGGIPGHYQDFSEETVQKLCATLVPYFRNGQYLMIDGQPVFFVHSPHVLLGCSQESQEPCRKSQISTSLMGARFRSLNACIRSAGFSRGARFVAVEMDMGKLNQAALLDAEISDMLTQEPTWAQVRNYVDWGNKAAALWVNEDQPLTFGKVNKVPAVYQSVHPGLLSYGSNQYRQNADLNANGGDASGTPSVDSPGTDTWFGATPARFFSNLRQAKTFVDARYHSGKMIMVDTWNNYLEETAVEPLQTFECQYLDAIKNYQSAGAGYVTQKACPVYLRPPGN